MLILPKIKLIGEITPDAECDSKTTFICNPDISLLLGHSISQSLFSYWATRMYHSNEVNGPWLPLYKVLHVFNCLEIVSLRLDILIILALMDARVRIKY